MKTKISEIRREKHELDAAGQVLGRFATQVATLLVGKGKPYFVRHLDCGDFVTVTNARKIVVTGKKGRKKVYLRYSGYPAGLKKQTFDDLQEKNPGEVIARGVYGMLPSNKLRSRWMRRLVISSKD